MDIYKLFIGSFNCSNNPDTLWLANKFYVNNHSTNNKINKKKSLSSTKDLD